MAEKDNIVLIGMPGCGKSAVAEALGKALGREVLDTDAYIEEHTGYTPEQIITMQGESVFRTHESEAVRELGSALGAIVATGGGAVLRAQNVRALRQNGVVVYIDRPLGQLAVGGARPLSQSAEALAAMHAARAPLYAAACDARVENDGPFESVAEAIKERFYEILDH